MARKPTTRIEPVEPVKSTEAEREEEKLPWLQRVEEDEPPSGTGKLAGYAIGAALLILVIAAIGYAILSRQNFRSSSQPEENLAALGAGESLLGNEQSGNEVVAASPGPSGRKTTGKTASSGLPDEPGSHARGPREERAIASRSSGSATRTEAAVSHRHAQASNRSSRSAGRHEGATAARRNEKRVVVPGPKRRHPHHATPATSGPTDLVQFGAYDRRSAAERAWSQLSRRLPYARARHSVERARVHGHVYYRLRAQLPARARQCRGQGRIDCVVVRWPH